MEEKMKRIKKHKQEIGVAEGEKIEEIAEKVVERIKEIKGKEETRDVKKKVKDKIEQKIKSLKRVIEEKEKKKRKNKIVIRELNINARVGNIKEAARIFLEQEFKVRENMKSVQTAGKEGREVTIIELEDTKKKIIREKKKLRDKYANKIYIDHDLTKEEREAEKIR